MCDHLLRTGMQKNVHRTPIRNKSASWSVTVRGGTRFHPSAIRGAGHRTRNRPPRSQQSRSITPPGRRHCSTAHPCPPRRRAGNRSVAKRWADPSHATEALARAGWAGSGANAPPQATNAPPSPHKCSPLGRECTPLPHTHDPRTVCSLRRTSSPGPPPAGHPEGSFPPSQGVRNKHMSEQAHDRRPEPHRCLPMQHRTRRRILRVPEVMEITGLSRTTIWRRDREGSFSQPIRLGGEGTRAIGWWDCQGRLNVARS